MAFSEAGLTLYCGEHLNNLLINVSTQPKRTHISNLVYEIQGLHTDTIGDGGSTGTKKHSRVRALVDEWNGMGFIPLGVKVHKSASNVKVYFFKAKHKRGIK